MCTARPWHCWTRVRYCAELWAYISPMGTYSGVSCCMGFHADTSQATSYSVFCALSILLVYLSLYRDSDDRFEIERTVELAMKAHQKIDSTSDLGCQKLLEVCIWRRLSFTRLTRRQESRSIVQQAAGTSLDGTTPNVCHFQSSSSDGPHQLLQETPQLRANQAASPTPPNWVGSNMHEVFENMV